MSKRLRYSDKFDFEDNEYDDDDFYGGKMPFNKNKKLEKKTNKHRQKDSNDEWGDDYYEDNYRR